MKEWTRVSLPRANLYGFGMANRQYPDIGNNVHYAEICSWCDKTIQEENLYRCEIDVSGMKHFWFKNPAHATMFALKWS
jgi:hypothetical protein